MQLEQQHAINQHSIQSRVIYVQPPNEFSHLHTSLKFVVQIPRVLAAPLAVFSKVPSVAPSGPGTRLGPLDTRMGQRPTAPQMHISSLANFCSRHSCQAPSKFDRIEERAIVEKKNHPRSTFSDPASPVSKSTTLIQRLTASRMSHYILANLEIMDLVRKGFREVLTATERQSEVFPLRPATKVMKKLDLQASIMKISKNIWKILFICAAITTYRTLISRTS